MGNNKKNNGDTLIEVLFAITVFALVVVGAISIMNQASATAQRALEITLVRHQIDAQAEALRFLNSSYVAAFRSGASNYHNSLGSDTPADEWLKIDKNITSASSFSNNCPVAGAYPPGSFILNTHKGLYGGTLSPAITFSQVGYNAGDNVSGAFGIWIEPVIKKTTTYANQKNADYIDFHIRACWDSPTQNVPLSIGTIVRLYEPSS